MLKYIIIVLILIIFMNNNTFTARDKPIAVPTKYADQKDFLIYHKFPIRTQLLANNDKIFQLHNVVHVKGFKSNEFDGKIKIKIIENTKHEHNEHLEVASWIMKPNNKKIIKLFYGLPIDTKIKALAEKYQFDIYKSYETIF